MQFSSLLHLTTLLNSKQKVRNHNSVLLISYQTEFYWDTKHTWERDTCPVSSFSALLIKLLRTKSLQILRRSENCKLIYWYILHVKVTNFLKLPRNSFFPWILLERKDRTCDYDTPKVKYNELYHCQWTCFFLQVNN